MTRTTLILTLTVVLATTFAGAVAAPALAEETDDGTDDYVELTFDEVDDEIVASAVDTNTDHDVTNVDDELPDIDLSGLEIGTTVTFEWDAVDADELQIEDEDGDVLETDDGDELTDDTGTLEADWNDSLDDDADAYHFDNAALYDDDEDAVGTIGGSFFGGGGVGDIGDDIDNTSLGIGAVGALVLVVGGIALAGRAN
ncbi:uncharacterized protein NP_5352A [Natronomonas pharaonis DSM 2160]|uniref:Uncharacterized protein n=1 Tax=Natronomonas pharaonis (strain ATCC 35678 / DSM 2160 / CIP 103997 / JCM 8858 / NBRC 14720 / NCIMB 2260 / Gabara) TaxID=348780 RepID=A0A1U7EZL2_NATPD|nr:hypothetical protein [Natronomonas pharaonis]CAI50767.1 uncharacterized protein NP_5352A [Natronomonas pharaonis DSM 2160]